MIVSETRIPGAFVIEPERWEDDRGFFGRLWCERECASHGLTSRVAQINVGFSTKRGTVRGMHYQVEPGAEAKTVRCTQGAIYDVLVDLRPTSPTYRRWIGVELTAGSRRALYIPEGCAQGYQTLADDTEIYYHTSQFYAPHLARGVRHDDPAFAIAWPLPVAALSDADRSWPDYREPPVASTGEGVLRT
jgi:dTDP-4-dehydrorhamnose 3,5-epimerase